MKFRKTAITAAVGVLALGGTVAYASIPDADGVIHGCRANATGDLYVKETGCPSGFTALDWNQTGSSSALNIHLMEYEATDYQCVLSGVGYWVPTATQIDFPSSVRAVYAHAGANSVIAVQGTGGNYDSWSTYADTSPLPYEKDGGARITGVHVATTQAGLAHSGNTEAECEAGSMPSVTAMVYEYGG